MRESMLRAPFLGELSTQRQRERKRGGGEERGGGSEGGEEEERETNVRLIFFTKAPSERMSSVRICWDSGN